MTQTEIKGYLDLINSIREFLGFKLDSLDGEASGKLPTPKKPTGAIHLTKIVTSGDFIFEQSREDTLDRVGLHGLLADILESLYQLVIAEREARESGHRERVERMIPEYMAACRRLLDEVDLAESLLLSERLSEGDYLADDRLELILNAIRKSTEDAETLNREYIYRRGFVWLGAIPLFLTLISALILLTLNCIDTVSDFLHYLPSEMVGEITKTSLSDSLAAKLTATVHTLSAVLLIAAFVALKIRGAILRRAIREGNVSARFVYAHHFLIIFGGTLGTDKIRYAHEILECAESGYPPALYQVGRMYEHGFAKIIVPDKRLALKYYSRAAKQLPVARERYEFLSKTFS